MREFAEAVAIGLSDAPRWLPCRYLYDERGSRLFEKICEQPEYYLTRAEAAILERAADDIRALTGPVTLIELGSGSSVKTSILLSVYEAVARPVRYVPVDVSASALAAARTRIAAQHPGVDVGGIRGTYDDAFALFRRHSPALVLFLGSTIGNFNQGEALAFWRRVARSLVPGDFFLLGVDLVKDRAALEAAYNDAAGVSAEFTRNLFARMNRELGSGVDLDAVEHEARWNAAWRRIEIFARFREPQTIGVEPLGIALHVEAGEQVMTEISRKFVLGDLTTYLSCFGFDVRRVYVDERQWFGVVLLQKR